MTWIWLLSKIECQSMGMDGREERALANFSIAWRWLTFILLGWVTFYYQQLMQILMYKIWREAWCVVSTMTKHWGGYCSFGASFQKFIFQHQKMILWNKWSFVQNKTLSPYTSCLNNSVPFPKDRKLISRGVFLKAFTHANTSLYLNGSLVSKVWTASNCSKDN